MSRQRRRLAAALLALLLATAGPAGAAMRPSLRLAAPDPATAAWMPDLGARPTLRRAHSFDQPLNVLFMATDVRYEQRDGRREMSLAGRTDTMILMRLDPAHGTARLLSIPRDTRVSLPGHGDVKINAANPNGGPALAARAVSGLLGVSVDRHVIVNTQAVIRLVDALGGVVLEIDKPMRYVDRAQGLRIDLAPGAQRLDGRAAHDFLRFRHDGQGDIGRVQRQQEFLRALAAQTLRPETLLRLPELLRLAQENLATDLPPEELLALASWARALGPAAIETEMLPGDSAMIGGGWYWLADPVATRRLVDGFLLGTPEQSAALP